MGKRRTCHWHAKELGLYAHMCSSISPKPLKPGAMAWKFKFISTMWKWDVWEITRIRWNHEGGGLMTGLVLFQEEQIPDLSLSPSLPQSPSLPCEDTKIRQLSEAKKRILVRTNHAGTLISDLWSPELWENKSLLISYPVDASLLWWSKLRQWVTMENDDLCYLWP